MNALTTFRLTVLAACSFWLAACSGASDSRGRVQEGPSLELSEDHYNFGSVTQGTRVEHAFAVANRGSQDLEIRALEGPEVFDRKEFPKILKPGESGEIVLGFDTRGLGGSGTLSVRIASNEPKAGLKEISLSGVVVPLVEIRPQNRVYFLDLPQGEGGDKELSIVIHQERPLRVIGVKPQPGGWFSGVLKPVREGSEYALTITLDAKAPAGRFEETLQLETDSPELPTIPIYARAWIVAEVSASPDEVRFSQVLLEDLDDEYLGHKQVRVRQRDGGGFKVLEATTDVPFISATFKPEKGGESYLISVKIDAAKAKRGEIRGTLTVRTNHPRFAVLKIPIVGTIV